jgi:hypothetical protein
MTWGEHCIAIRLQWISGHCDAAGNDAADRRAREAASPENPTLSILCLLERNLSSEMRVAVNGRKNGVKERQPSSQYRQRTTGYINQTTLRIDLQKWGLSTDTNSHGPLLVVHLRDGLSLPEQ